MQGKYRMKKGLTFEDELVSEKWNEVSGDRGDIYRQLIINPIIYNLLINIDSRLQTTPDKWDNIDPFQYEKSPLTSWLAEFYEDVNSNSLQHLSLQDSNGDLTSSYILEEKRVELEFARWKLAKLAFSNEISVVDFGCGNGYRAKWLGNLNLKYHGFDISEYLIDAAQKLCIGMENVTLKKKDLRHSFEIPVLAKSICFLAITLFDHLPEESVERVLKVGMKDRRSSGSCDYGLVVTCNPLFYKNNQNFEENSEKSDLLKSLSDNGYTNEIKFFRRSSEFYFKIFQKLNIQVIDYVSPTLANYHVIKEDSDGQFDKVVGPFNIWLITFPNENEKVEELEKAIQLLTKNAPDSFGVNVIEAVRKLDMIKKLSVVTSEKNENIVHGGNLAGDLRIIFEGQARLGKRSKLSFDAGDVIGDIETNMYEGDQTFFRTNVIANEKCKFIRVPHTLATKLFEPTSFGAKAHQYVRKKLRFLIPQMLSSRIPFKTVSQPRSIWFTKQLDGKTLQAAHILACLLVVALDNPNTRHIRFLGRKILCIQRISEFIGSLDMEKLTKGAAGLLTCSGVLFSCQLEKKFYKENFENSDSLSKESINIADKLITNNNQAAFFYIENEYYLRKVASFTMKTKNNQNLLLAKYLDDLASMLCPYTLNNEGLRSINSSCIKIPTIETLKSSTESHFEAFSTRREVFKQAVIEYITCLDQQGFINDSIGLPFFHVKPNGQQNVR